MRDYYIFKSGILKRKDNTIFFEFDNSKKVLPINDIDSIYIFGEVEINSKLIDFLSQNRVIVHFFNYFGFYSGTFYPREFLNSGDLLIEQVKHYTSKRKRIKLAKQFVKGAIYGSVMNLKRYKEKIKEEIEILKNFYEKIDYENTVTSIMGIEGNAKNVYYSTFEKILNQEIEFKKRVKHPPDNMINALISFLNSLVYTLVLKEIYKTQLNPTISYLHKPGSRRFSLSLDISEIFKPIFADRILFELINNNIINKRDFDKSLNYIYLKEEGRKKVIQSFEEKINKKIIHKTLKRKVSYKTIVRLELYKLIKHLLNEEEYKHFKIWW